ncbi:MAG: hypothetical protein V4493_09265 [Pseudomonadota bacterium]
MKKTKKILMAFAMAVSLLIILPFLIPMQTYLYKIERVASGKLGVPVTIATGHWLFLPSQRVVVSDITVGGAQEVKVAQLTVIPTLSSLFAATLKVSKPIVK